MSLRLSTYPAVDSRAIIPRKISRGGVGGRSCRSPAFRRFQLIVATNGQPSGHIAASEATFNRLASSRGGGLEGWLSVLVRVCLGVACHACSFLGRERPMDRNFVGRQVCSVKTKDRRSSFRLQEQTHGFLVGVLRRGLSGAYERERKKKSLDSLDCFHCSHQA